jgi:predicted nucleic acid-binding Zn ribbon protein
MNEAGEGLQGIRDALARLSRRLGLPDPGKAGAIWGRWEELVGAEIAGHARPSSLRDGVLRVRADSPGWAHELGYLREEIKGRVNAGLGHPAVAEVRVYTAPPEPASTGRAEREKEARRGPVAAPKPAPPGGPEEALERAKLAWLRRRKRWLGPASSDPSKTRK